MQVRRLLTPLGSAPRAFALIAAAAVVALAGASAQTPPAPAKPAAPKQTAPKQAAPKQPAAPPQAAPGQQPGEQQQMQFIYTPWVKVCGKNPQDPNAKEVCQTAREARLETGQFMAAAALVEPTGDPKKVLQIMLPTGVMLQHGTRVIVDKGQPLSAPYFICFVNGCLSQYEVTQEFVGKMKSGQTLEIQAVNPAMQSISFYLPLADFAKANDGPPTDPKVLEEQHKKLQDELQRRAEEARKKLLESQPAQPGATK